MFSKVCKSDDVPVTRKTARILIQIVSNFGIENTIGSRLLYSTLVIVTISLQLNLNFFFLCPRAQMREKHLARRAESDLYKAQKSCRQLDLAKEYAEPVELWFWPKDPKERLLLVCLVSTMFKNYHIPANGLLGFMRIRVSDPDSGVFWIRVRIRNPNPRAYKKVKNVK